MTLLNNRTNFTVCGWVNVAGIAQGGLFGQNNVVEFRFLNTTEIELWTSYGSIDYTVGNAITPGQWAFLAASGTTNTLSLYINGQVVATAASTATSGYGTYTDPFLLSGNTSGNGDPSINGLMDEVAVYPRALSDAEIASLYAAGAYGTVTPPFVTLEPNAQTVAQGSTVTIPATVAGSLPLSYQWKQGGVNVPGATSATLTLSNVDFPEAGSYVLWATNTAGYTNTSPSTLTVMPRPTFANLTNDLVLHLRFDGNYTDSSGEGDDASAPNGSPPFVAGKVGQAVHIATASGTNYLVVNDNASVLTFDETTSFTIAFWV